MSVELEGLSEYPESWSVTTVYAVLGRALNRVEVSLRAMSHTESQPCGV